MTGRTRSFPVPAPGGSWIRRHGNHGHGDPCRGGPIIAPTTTPTILLVDHDRSVLGVAARESLHLTSFLASGAVAYDGLGPPGRGRGRCGRLSDRASGPPAAHTVTLDQLPRGRPQRCPALAAAQALVCAALQGGAGVAGSCGSRCCSASPRWSGVRSIGVPFTELCPPCRAHHGVSLDNGMSGRAGLARTFRWVPRYI